MLTAAIKVSMIGLLQVAAVLTIIFSLLTAVNISHQFVELFGHFRLQYFATGLLLAIVFAITRQWPYAIVLLLVTCINGSFLLPWYLADDHQARGAEQLKLFHANVYSGNRQFTRLIESVASEDPDVIFLQEVTADWVAEARRLQNDYPYVHAEPRGGNFGIAVYSRFPFDSITHIDSPPLGYPTIVAHMTRGGKPLTLISSHPTIPLSNALYGARNEQLDSLAELVSAQTGEVVLSGDFNESIWGPRLRKLLESTRLRNARKGFGVLPTWPTALPIAMIPIDHVLVSDGIAVLDMKTGRRTGSDHLPLVVTLSL